MGILTDRRLRFALISAVTILVLDQVTKSIVASSMRLYESIPLLPFFSLTYVRNTGAAFGLLGGLPPTVRLPLFCLVTVGAVFALVSYLRDLRPDESLIAIEEEEVRRARRAVCFGHFLRFIVQIRERVPLFLSFPDHLFGRVGRVIRDVVGVDANNGHVLLHGLAGEFRDCAGQVERSLGHMHQPAVESRP